jgi:putative tricarboxylic transport membrane protein
VRSVRARERGPAWAPRGAALRHVVVVLGVTIAFVALIKTLGMVLGSALFLAVLVRYLGRHSWFVVLSVAAGAAVFNYLVFAHWLRVPFPEGPFGF